MFLALNSGFHEPSLKTTDASEEFVTRMSSFHSTTWPCFLTPGLSPPPAQRPKVQPCSALCTVNYMKLCSQKFGVTGERAVWNGIV